jgi:hypothetical protein
VRRWPPKSQRWQSAPWFGLAFGHIGLCTSVYTAACRGLCAIACAAERSRSQDNARHQRSTNDEGSRNRGSRHTVTRGAYQGPRRKGHIEKRCRCLAMHVSVRSWVVYERRPR